MKKEHDFSKGVRGKFYRKNARIRLPVYLNKENMNFVERIASRKNEEVSEIVNDLIKGDKDLARTIG
jgi:DNA-directed RNA polymerase subunit F